MAIIDDVIGVFSPGWKAARLRSRALMTLESLSQIRAGRQEWERRLAAMVSRRRGKPGFKLARF
ncbi:hypothetical protein ABLH45_004789 [Escherichia coli]